MRLSSNQVSTDDQLIDELNWSTPQNMLLTISDNSIVQQQQQQQQQPSKLPIKRSLQTAQQSDVPAVECPRCDSTNTKFCYYNNYNKTQPRHFCKACKRHWTKGGTLRNVPVGGGRNNKRIKRPNTSTTTPKDHNSLGLSDQKKYMFPNHDHKDLFFIKPSDHHSEEEFDDQVSWGFNVNDGLITTTMQQLHHHHHPNLGFSSFIDTNPIIPSSFTSGFKDDSAQYSWMQVPATSNFLEPIFWGWNIDNDDNSMNQAAADLNKLFDDQT